MIIYTKNGDQIIVGWKDRDLAQLKWYVSADGYIVRNVRNTVNKQTLQILSRLVLERKLGRKLLPGHKETCDHINLNKLDNRRGNLRLATNGQNNANKKKRSDCTSQYKGVWWNTFRKVWEAEIKKDQSTIRLGCFTDEIEAARAYDKAAKKYFGRFARINGV